ncbi:hypothetical protein GA0115252_10936 [Streptomyces sp. DfronAA-171]|nr:hypothetical protein GA0115252_10936 [Streptomyces sp. DfronAA-171]SCE27029.1 hypothetical protein GA0115246_113473 [Streptomyces sp. SolWspMP-sol7th]
MSHMRSWPAAYPAPNSVPYRVVPLMCGMPYFLSRVIVTSARGEVTDSVSALLTPKEASSKKFPSCASVREGYPDDRES